MATFSINDASDDNEDLAVAELAQTLAEISSSELALRLAQTLNVITMYGDIDGAHHKQWILDQAIRTILATQEAYDAWLKAFREEDENGDYEYEWDEGIAP